MNCEREKARAFNKIKHNCKRWSSIDNGSSRATSKEAREDDITRVGKVRLR
jgi:hypothetical protein